MDILTILIFQYMTWTYLCFHQFLFAMSSHFHYQFFTNLAKFIPLFILFDAAMSGIVSLTSLSNTLLLGSRNAIYLGTFISNASTSLISLKF